MPVLQLHLVLCTTFTAAANKYQFLELSPNLIERLGAVGQLSQPVRYVLTYINDLTFISLHSYLVIYTTDQEQYITNYIRLLLLRNAALKINLKCFNCILLEKCQKYFELSIPLSHVHS